MEKGETIVSIFIAVISMTLYSNSILCGFVFDDLPAVVNNNDLHPESPWDDMLWHDFWGTPMKAERSHKSYRPLTVLTFKITNLVFSKDAWSYHAVNMILHTVVSLLYLRVSLTLCNLCSKHDNSFKNNKLMNSQREMKTGHASIEPGKKCQAMSGWNTNIAPYVASILFAVHPVHCEAVTGVVGRAELLSAMFMLLTIMCYSHFTIRSTLLSGFFCLCAVASKEQGITVVAICIVIDLFVAHRLTPMELLFFRKTSNIYTGLRTAVLALVTILLLWWRLQVMGMQLPSFTHFDNPASVTSTPSRQLTYNYLLAVDAEILLSPHKLLCDWTMGTIPLVSGFSDFRNLKTTAFWYVMIALSHKAATGSDSHSKMVLVALSLLVFPFLPASNLFFPVGFVVAERILYAPSMGFCLLVAVGFDKMLSFKKYKKIMCVLMTILVLCHSIRTFTRNSEWKSDNTLFMSALKITQNNAKIWNNIGHSLENNDPKEALAYFTEAAKVQPDDFGSHMNIGRMKNNLSDPDGAEKAFLRAKDLLPRRQKGNNAKASVAPDHLKVFVHLANLMKSNSSRLKEADALYREAIAMRSDFLDAYINRGEILLMANQFQEAVECYKAALKYAPNKDDIFFNLGVVMSKMGNVSGAVEQYTYAIQENPNHIKALYNSAAIFEETRDPDLLRRARIRIDRILSLEPDNYLAYSLLGSIYLDNNEEENAAKSWKKVLELQPNDKSALFNMAFMYSKVKGKTQDCIKYVEELLSHHPKHVKGLMLYGDVLLTRERDFKGSANAFRRCIEAEPNNIQARHNYCVVLLEEGLLADAEKCMYDVFLMAPSEKYVADNLSIIKRQVAKQREDLEGDLLRFSSGSERTQPLETETEKFTEDLPEELVYIEPLPKTGASKTAQKEKSATQRAKNILTDAENSAKIASMPVSSQEERMSRLESALKEVHNAVNKLDVLNDELDNKQAENCLVTKTKPAKTSVGVLSEVKDSNEVKVTQSSEESTDDLKTKALDYLNELENTLG